ncbi:MAG: ADP-heptose--LPS heptosyltransferase [Gemmatimonadetes bacterium]|nr:ADP-heptose--LPS heptosyltransferase [Gemmatimonadota bacterium]
MVRCDHIGDAVMATGVITRLHEALAPERLDVLAGPWAASLFEMHPAVDETIVYAAPWWSKVRGAGLRARLLGWMALPGIVRRLRRSRYDIAIDLRGDLRQILFFLALPGARQRASSDRTGGVALLTHVASYAARHEVESNAAVLRALGIEGDVTPAVRSDVPLAAGEEDELRATSGAHGFLALALGSNKPKQGWPVPEAAALARAARSRGLGVVFVGGAAEHDIGEAVRSLAGVPVLNLAGRTSLPQTVSVLARAAATVSVDSGPMHLAAAAGGPVVGLFGPTDPALYRPWSIRAGVVRADVRCECTMPACDYTEGPGRCMRTLPAARVLEALDALGVVGALS